MRGLRARGGARRRAVRFERVGLEARKGVRVVHVRVRTSPRRIRRSPAPAHARRRAAQNGVRLREPPRPLDARAPQKEDLRALLLAQKVDDAARVGLVRLPQKLHKPGLVEVVVVEDDGGGVVGDERGGAGHLGERAVVDAVAVHHETRVGRGASNEPLRHFVPLSVVRVDAGQVQDEAIVRAQLRPGACARGRCGRSASAAAPAPSSWSPTRAGRARGARRPWGMGSPGGPRRGPRGAGAEGGRAEGERRRRGSRTPRRRIRAPGCSAGTRLRRRRPPGRQTSRSAPARKTRSGRRARLRARSCDGSPRCRARACRGGSRTSAAQPWAGAQSRARASPRAAGTSFRSRSRCRIRDRGRRPSGNERRLGRCAGDVEPGRGHGGEQAQGRPAGDALGAIRVHVATRRCDVVVVAQEALGGPNFGRSRPCVDFLGRLCAEWQLWAVVGCGLWAVAGNTKLGYRLGFLLHASW